MPDDQFQLDAERHAQFVPVHVRQLVAVEPQCGRQSWPVLTLVALIVREPGLLVAIVVWQFRPVRQRGFLVAERVAVRRFILGRRLERLRATATAPAGRVAHTAGRRRHAGQHTEFVRSTGR